MEANMGKLEGRGTVTRADGTVVEFVLTSEITEEQAEALNLIKPKREEAKEET